MARRARRDGGTAGSLVHQCPAQVQRMPGKGVARHAGPYAPGSCAVAPPVDTWILVISVPAWDSLQARAAGVATARRLHTAMPAGVQATGADTWRHELKHGTVRAAGWVAAARGLFGSGDGLRLHRLIGMLWESYVEAAVWWMSIRAVIVVPSVLESIVIWSLNMRASHNPR